MSIVARARVPADAAYRVNKRVWSQGNFVAEYATRDLRPVEALLLARYREALSGRTLELGCGAGRLTGYLAALARETHGIDLSPAMVDYCKRRYPNATFSVGDLRDLSGFESGSYDTIVAAFNVIDVFDDAERRAVLDEIHRLLADDGLFIMSAHNRAFLPQVRTPTTLRARNPVRLLGKLALMPWRMRNHHRLAPLEHAESDYAIVNDEALNFTLLHYYVERDAQERQLNECGFELVEALDRDGEVVFPGDTAPSCPDIHYVAKRAGEPAR
jgi:SAM-dependent methyltransferase